MIILSILGFTFTYITGVWFVMFLYGLFKKIYPEAELSKCDSNDVFMIIGTLFFPVGLLFMCVAFYIKFLDTIAEIFNIEY